MSNRGSTTGTGWTCGWGIWAGGGDVDVDPFIIFEKVENTVDATAGNWANDAVAWSRIVSCFGSESMSWRGLYSGEAVCGSGAFWSKLISLKFSVSRIGAVPGSWVGLKITGFISENERKIFLVFYGLENKQKKIFQWQCREF